MSTSNEISTGMIKWMQKKTTNKPKNCLICGKFTRFKYYNVQSCNGCKQFFRRIVLNQIEYFCQSDGKCDLTKEKCRGCRLDKCLLFGMDPSSVHNENKHEINHIHMAVTLAARRKLLLDSKMNTSKKIIDVVKSYRYCHQITNEIELDYGQIEYMTKILNAHRRIADGCFDLPDTYLNKFRGIEEFLNGHENILSLANCYSSYIELSSNDEIIKLQTELIEIGYGEMHSKVQKMHIVYHLMIVGILKAMPIFRELSLKDKEILVHELGHQINNLTNTYYSMEMGEISVTGPRGLCRINVIENICKDIPRILEMAKIVFLYPIEAFRRIPMLSKEEFALIIAIHFSNPAISGLSSHARELLYKEQCRYSQLLLKYCQRQAGNDIKGAQRYAECLQLIECAFQAVRYFELILTYIEMFLSGRHYFDDIPSECVIKSLIKLLI